MSGFTGRTAKEQLTVNDIRYNNKVNLFTDIVSSSGITRNDLAVKNNISIMTVKNIVDELLDLRMVEEHQMNSAVGRKPMALRVASQYGNIVCINLSSINEIRFVIYDLRGETLASGRTRFKNQEKYYIEKIEQAIGEIKDKLAGISTATIGVAVFIPGVYYDDEDRVEFAMFSELGEVKIRETFTEAFHVDNIQIIHDIHASAKAEYELRAAEGDTQLYLYCGDGVASCLTKSDGSPELGQDLIAGEIGNIIYDWNDDGSPIRMESMLSVSEIKKRLPRAYREQEFEEALDAYKKDPAVTKVLDEALDAAAEMLHNIVWALNPTRIVVDSYCKQYAEMIVLRAKSFFRKHFNEEFLQETELSVTRSDEYHTLSECMKQARACWIEQVVGSPEDRFMLLSGNEEGIG